MDIRGVSIVYHIPSNSILYIYNIYPYSYCLFTENGDPAVGATDPEQAQLRQSRPPWHPWADSRALHTGLAHRSHADVYVCASECRKRPEKRAAVLATGADISSSLSHEETGCSNQDQAQK